MPLDYVPITAADLPEYVKLAEPMMLEEDFITLEEWDQYSRRGDFRAWFIYETGAGDGAPGGRHELAGWCCLADPAFAIDDAGRTHGEYLGLYGAGILPAFRGRGYGRESMLWRMAQYPGRSFVTHVQPGNIASLNMVISCGFRPRFYKKPWIGFIREANA